jgi:hypothetical protein
MATNNISDCIVKDSEKKNTWVQHQPDVLIGEPASNKAVFDAFPELISDKHNALIDYISSNFTDANIDGETTLLYQSLGWIPPNE